MRFAEPSVSVKDAEVDLANREARVSALEAELAAERTEIERIRIYLELSKRYGGSGAIHEPPPPLNGASAEPPSHENAAPLEDEPLIQACRGKSIPDASIALIQLAGHPLSEEALVDRLRRGGVTLVSSNPALNLRFALLRKRRETGAVKLTADKKLWDLGENPPESEAHKQSGFVQNRDRNNHAERSRQGLLAARERGAKNGRKFTITPEIKEVAESLMAEGMRVGEIAELIGVSAPTFNRWRKLGLVNVNRPSNPGTTSSD
jgi:hypothetical protein